MCAKTERDAANRHILSDLQDLLFAVEKHNINGELHAEGVYRLAGNDPEALTRRKAGVLQQSGAPCPTVVGNADGLSQ